MATILLVEDDIGLRKQIRFSLENDFSLLEAGNQKEASALLRCNAVDVIILDLGLPPNENTPDEGLQILDHAIKKHSAKVIILTGQKTESVAVEAIRNGAFDYLLKPVSMEKLHHSVERALLFKEAENELMKMGVKKISFDFEAGKGLQAWRDEAGKNIILQVLRDTGFNIYQSAKILGVKRESLYYFLKKFGVKRNHDS